MGQIIVQVLVCGETLVQRGQRMIINLIFVLATHYHAFSRQTGDGEPVRTLLFDLLDEAQGMPDVSFAGVNSIW